MITKAKCNNEIYVPNIAPNRPVDYVFICMEPSLGEWAGDRENAQKRLKAGFRNFIDGYNTQLLHFAIRKYLCKKDQRYHITDLSKGAMLVKDAGEDRVKRYDDWYPLLLEEIKLVASPQAKIFAVGAHVNKFLECRGFPSKTTLLIHYSGNAVGHWNKAVTKYKEDFRLFEKTVKNEDVTTSIKQVVESSGVPKAIQEQVLAKLKNSNLTLSRLKLIFNYKLMFDSVRTLNQNK